MHSIASIENFLLSSSSCSGCSFVLRVLDAVTDIRRSGIKQVNFSRGELDPSTYNQNVLKIICDRSSGGWGYSFDREEYDIYTPVNARVEHAIPWLGVGSAEGDGKRDQPDSLSDRLKEAQNWFQRCKKDHPLCLPLNDEWPRRILDITVDPIRLVTSTSILPSPTYRQEGYACLSYVWGTTGNLETRKENLKSHMCGIDTSALPKTLSDAVYVARYLGLQYLWIDSLCIIQDDWQDKMHQIPRMPNIYQGCELVIAAQSAANVHKGFLSFPEAHAPFKRIQTYFRMEDGTFRTVEVGIRKPAMAYFGAPAHHSQNSIENGAFQETFMARRTLYATPSELAWKCTMQTRCECSLAPHECSSTLPLEYDHYARKFIEPSTIHNLGQISRARSLKMTDQPLIEDVKIWTDIVKEYSGRKLSEWTDRLAAIQGVANSMTQIIPEHFKNEDYLFGLWKPLLIHQLAWYRYSDPFVPANVVVGLKKMAPSWSWVTCIGNINFPDYTALSFAKVIEVEKAPHDGHATHIFGAGSCTLTIMGFCIPVRKQRSERRASDDDEERFTYIFPKLLNAKDCSSISIHMNIDDPTDTGAQDRAVYFLPLVATDWHYMWARGLLLERVVEEQSNCNDEKWGHLFEGTFRRVGCGGHGIPRDNLYYSDPEKFNEKMRFIKLKFLAKKKIAARSAKSSRMILTGIRNVGECVDNDDLEVQSKPQPKPKQTLSFGAIMADAQKGAQNTVTPKQKEPKTEHERARTAHQYGLPSITDLQRFTRALQDGSAFRGDTYRPNSNYGHRSPWEQHEHCPQPDIRACVTKLSKRIIGKFEDMQNGKLSYYDIKDGKSPRRPPPIQRVEREVQYMYWQISRGKHDKLVEHKESLKAKLGVEARRKEQAELILSQAQVDRQRGGVAKGLDIDDLEDDAPVAKKTTKKTRKQSAVKGLDIEDLEDDAPVVKTTTKNIRKKSAVAIESLPKPDDRFKATKKTASTTKPKEMTPAAAREVLKVLTKDVAETDQVKIVNKPAQPSPQVHEREENREAAVEKTIEPPTSPTSAASNTPAAATGGKRKREPTDEGAATADGKRKRASTASSTAKAETASNTPTTATTGGKRKRGSTASSTAETAEARPVKKTKKTASSPTEEKL
ncbi:heterokaryon incompatibility [Pyrenophora seminiperda CCB06]|uniref:Heterokaryon incompatibility n=1 Tax=Pyrenophora seminiperda CCB06 TaxID=1302712 RepID=A0A3M7MFT1_9PLEO|nr:heterokaryon incompatibility [Pyrenophora seminiperda CCB06]